MTWLLGRGAQGFQIEVPTVTSVVTQEDVRRLRSELVPGDVVTASISHPLGAADLGTQRTTIVAPRDV